MDCVEEPHPVDFVFVPSPDGGEFVLEINWGFSHVNAKINTKPLAKMMGIEIDPETIRFVDETKCTPREQEIISQFWRVQEIREQRKMDAGA